MFERRRTATPWRYAALYLEHRHNEGARARRRSGGLARGEAEQRYARMLVNDRDTIVLSAKSTEGQLGPEACAEVAGDMVAWLSSRLERRLGVPDNPPIAVEVTLTVRVERSTDSDG